MTEWEKLKKEYREIPVPEKGPHQMLQTIAKAKDERMRHHNLARYGTVAAAAFLVLLLPGMLLLSGGLGGSQKNSAMMEADCAVQSVPEGGWYAKDSMDETTIDNTAAEAPEYSYKNDVQTTFKATAEGVIVPATEETSLPDEHREAISREIFGQMEERMQNNNETYYVKGEECPENFTYYINEEGLLVVVFEAGLIAPKEQGTVEFIIPAEVYSPTE